MRRLPIPEIDSWEATEKSALRFHGEALGEKVAANEPIFKTAFARYLEKAQHGTLYELVASTHGNPGQIVLGDLSKGELASLYSDGMVMGDQSARDIYDALLISSGRECPYCAGLGHVGGLDHFLAKARYPSYSTLLINLIPCCEKCNKLSGSSVLLDAASQTLNPYFDQHHFFEQAWVKVEFYAEDLLSYRYVCEPPVTWDELSCLRVRRHFEDLHLSLRFGTAASAEISYVSFLRESMLGSCDLATFQSLISSKANTTAYDLNGWQRPLYRSLVEADWFFEGFD